MSHDRGHEISEEDTVLSGMAGGGEQGGPRIQTQVTSENTREVVLGMTYHLLLARAGDGEMSSVTP